MTLPWGSPELLSVVLDAVPVATVVLDADAGIVACNGLAEQLLRLPPAWQGRSILADQDAELVSEVARLLGGEPVARETRVRLGDGSWRSLSWKGTPLTDGEGGPLGAVAVIEDTSRRQAARRDTALLDALFREAPVGLAVYDQAGHYTRVNRALEAMDGLSDSEHRGHRSAELLPGLRSDVDRVVARVFETGEPAPDIEVRGTTPAAEAQRTWLHSFFRLEHGGQPVGVGAVVRDVTDQRQAELDRASAAQRLAFIGEAGEKLASTLEPDAVLDLLCRLAVPALADHVMVDVVDDTGRLRRRAARHAGTPRFGHVVPRTVGEPADYPAGHPARRAVEQGQALLVRDAEPDSATFPHVPGLRSVLVLPMSVGGQVIGVSTLLFAGSGRTYGDAEAALARDLVSRAAVAMANALSYEQQRSAAVALQRSLLPEGLGDVEGLQVAWRYLPGAKGTKVGGDWADVFPLPSGRTAIVVGDVMGRGLRAAAVMGQVRTAVRVLAYQDPPPSEVLRSLDLAVSGLADGQLVTCVYAVFDPAREVLTVASAGHVPPVMVGPDGKARVLSVDGGLPVGVPLGVRADLGYEEVEIAMPHGSGLALYTDGLVEAPGRDVDAGIAGLVDALETHSWDDLEKLCDLAVAAGVPHAPGHPDDVALLLVRAASDAAGHVMTVDLPPDPAAVSPARALFVSALERWGLAGDPVALAGQLLVSEVVTNAIRYARGDVGLLVRRAERAVHVEVRDHDTRLPRLRHATLDDEGGRGLALVQALSRDWGARPLPDGKVVWFTLDAPGR
ncbi:SpoIIE family protein phosphatase [Motilibacter peucedani]|uniref:SpoIIE family protein phosphatase n=1 Tax=Motilibacter peucedani TaxID=598650 RepID=UPI0015FEC8EA|nr:SpoIIE family protein phosphatase [Motilibacter peucedani]